MAGVTYSCPNCGSYLAFNPELQKWKCGSCGSVFDEQTLVKKAAEYQQQAESQQAEQAHEGHTHEPAQPEQSAGSQVVYHCPACGSEIITDETTVATSCYYCHNPVVLQGKLTADMKPDQVLPFTIGEQKAVDGFLQWVSKKRFVPKGFFARDQIKQMEGVYYPHFISDCVVDGA
jgi:DNA-directed RNA polymerase subunit M/transcription elongation factor TFIIS